MSKTGAVLGSALFFVIAPFMLGFVVPWWIAGWHMHGPLYGEPLLQLGGIPLVLSGLWLLLPSFKRFALDGLGTPAPIAPPRRLVVTGLYRYMRNPMYFGVYAIILGNALILGDQWIIHYATLVALGFIAFVFFYEEPALVRQFGDEYREYRKNVPRFIPRFTPWKPTTRE
ncbi:MAG TPA: isoprenylcysteine carboxylmethyltransferase family protein [Rhizomicrobium sp.]|nr:isoprenylcysteine carboxylmethyltransferase family protein [Rhizomicrobium sp.]